MPFYQSLLDIQDIRQPLSLQQCRELCQELKKDICSAIYGQENLVRRILIALLLKQHVLLEGLPGLAKTDSVKILSQLTQLHTQRVQFVPDMMPSDLVGKNNINLSTMQTIWVPGPLFSNIIIADEINRAPAKVQAAILESMAENTITPFGQPTRIIRGPEEEKMWDYFNAPIVPGGPALAEKTAIKAKANIFGANPIDLDNPKDNQFTVLATMNPIETEGTYPLSEAQLDRFLFKVVVPYPSFATLNEIHEKFCGIRTPVKVPALKPDDLMRLRFRSLYFFRRCHQLLQEQLEQLAKIQKHNPVLINDLLTRIRKIVFFSSYQGQDAVANPLQLEIRRELALLGGLEQQPIRSQSAFNDILSGSSPRGLKLLDAALAEAFLDPDVRIRYVDMDWNETEDPRLPNVPWLKIENLHIKQAAYDVLRHRIRLRVQAKFKGNTSENIIETLLQAFAP